MIVNVAD